MSNNNNKKRKIRRSSPRSHVRNVFRRLIRGDNDQDNNHNDDNHDDENVSQEALARCRSAKSIKKIAQEMHNPALQEQIPIYEVGMTRLLAIKETKYGKPNQARQFQHNAVKHGVIALLESCFGNNTIVTRHPKTCGHAF